MLKISDVNIFERYFIEKMFEICLTGILGKNYNTSFMFKLPLSSLCLGMH